MVEVSPQSVERIAIRVAQILEERHARRQDELICAGELAQRLGVGRPWVYRHASALGGFRIDHGPKAQWRFDFAEAGERFRRLQDGPSGEER